VHELRVAGHGLLLDGGTGRGTVGRRGGWHGPGLREGVGGEACTSDGTLRAFGPIGRFLALHAITPQLLLHGVGVILETLTLGVVEGAEASKQVVSERVAVGLGLQKFAGPSFALDGASVEFLDAVDQPDLLLLEHLNVSINGGSQLVSR